MATGWRGVAAGALALVSLEVLVSTSASDRLSGLFALPGTWASNFLDPSIPTFHTGNKPVGDWTPSSDNTTGGAAPIVPAVLIRPSSSSPAPAPASSASTSKGTTTAPAGGGNDSQLA